MVELQVMTFNTTEKTVILRKGFKGEELISFSNVSTVKFENGFFEVMQKSTMGTSPVLRVPVMSTNMLIEK